MYQTMSDRSNAVPLQDEERALLGKDLKTLRKNRGLTLAALAASAGCSVGYLSEVERGERIVSIKLLRSIADVYELPLGWFFSHQGQSAEERGKIVRAKHRKRIGSHEDGLIEELVSPDLSGAFEMFLTRIEPGARSNGDLFRGVEEEGYIVSGQLTLVIGDQSFSLENGDSFRIHKETFSWHNPGSSVTQVLWVTSPPVY